MPVDNRRSLLHLLSAAEAAPTLRRIVMRLYNRLLKERRKGCGGQSETGKSCAPIGVHRIVSPTVAMTNLVSCGFLFGFFLFCCKGKFFVFIYIHNYCVSLFKIRFKNICSQRVLYHSLNRSFEWPCSVNG